MDTRRLTSREASFIFRAAAVKCRAGHRKQQPLQALKLRKVKAGEELFAQYSMKYKVELSSMQDL